MVFLIGNGFWEQLEDTTEYKESEVILSVGDGLVIVGDGGGGLNERLEDVCSFTVGDILLGLFFEFGAELGDEVFFLHCRFEVQQLYYYFD